MTDIFLSYTSDDREKVRPIRNALAAMDYNVFWDIETPAGENWDRWIRLRIAEAKVVIVFWTRGSAASVNVQHEAAIAREDNKLIAAQLEVMKPIDFPMGFYTTQAPQLADWTGQATHVGYSSLIKAIRQRFERAPDQVAELAHREEETEIDALRRKSTSGDAVAQTELGYRFSKGLGVARDDREAVRLYSLAAAQGLARAQFNLALKYAEGAGIARDENEAIRLYRLAADQGDIGAQLNLAFRYANGKGVVKDENEAAKYYKAAAGQGDPEAQAELGYRLSQGLGIGRNEREAVKYYRLSAAQGLARAQFNLALRHAEGRGVEKNQEEATRLYWLAAEQGDVGAQLNLAIRYARGEGVAKDAPEALRLYKLAAVGGSRPAQEFLKSKGIAWQSVR